MKQSETNFDILGLDIGTVRVGLALGNSKTGDIKILQTVSRAQNKAEKYVIDLIIQHNLKAIVVGIPLNEKSQKTEQSIKTEQFVRRIERRTNIELHFVDEWGSSIEAKRRLNIADLPGKTLRKSGIIDGKSASIILEEFFKQ